MNVLEAEGLWARYPGQNSAGSALADLSLSLQPGERLLLLGPNGAGKSTFIRVFAGLMRPARGVARVLGQAAPAARQWVGVVSHAPYLYDELTVRENLRLYAELYDVPAPSQRAMHLLEQVGLPHLAEQRVGRLSRGQQQRVTIARALLHAPELLLLDEPDTGLDLAAFELLAELVRRDQRTVVFTTHNLAAGVQLATRAVVLAHGRLVHHEPDLQPAALPHLSAILQAHART